MDFTGFTLPVTESDVREIVQVASEEALGAQAESIEKLHGDNKLSNVYIVEEKYLTKVVTRRHVEAHRLFTLFWNASAISVRGDSLFDSYWNPYEMVENEYESTRAIRECGVNAPEPIDAIECRECGVLFIEYLPDARQFAELSGDEGVEMADELFASLSKMHDAGIIHGDLQQDNVLIVDSELYIIDPTNVRREIEAAKQYDLASALATVTSVIDARQSVILANKHFDKEDILMARRFIDAVVLQLGHTADAIELKSQIDGELSRSSD